MCAITNNNQFIHNYNHMDLSPLGILAHCKYTHSFIALLGPLHVFRTVVTHSSCVKSDK